MNRIAGRAGITLVICLMLVAGFSFFLFEFITEAGDWVIFPGSPHVYSGSNLGTGLVVSADGQLLLDMEDGREYAQDSALRQATLHWLGDRYGSVYAPALGYYADKITGYDLLNGTYHYGKSGGVAQLTLYAQIQKAALEAMGDRKGTVAIYNYKTGQLICAVTTPTYDPNNVPDLSLDVDGIYEGMYVNRFTQSAYIPGSIFKIVTLAAALEELPDVQEMRFSCNGMLEFGPDKVTCEQPHWNQSLQQAFRNSCNCAFAQLALRLGADTLERYVEQFQITDSVSFDGITTAEGNFQVQGEADVNMAWSAIGQHMDQINPCRFMTFLGAIANGGQGVDPYLVETVTVGTETTYTASAKEGVRLMSESTALVLQQYLRSNVELKYGDDYFPGLTVCAKTGTGEVDGQKPNAMLTGFCMDEDYPLAFIVAVENAGYGASVCLPILSEVLASAREILGNS